MGLRKVDHPYTLRLYGVTEEMFDEVVTPDIKADLLDGVMIVHSPAAPRHDDVAGFIRTAMRSFASYLALGIVLGPDVLFHPKPGRRFAPDILFVETAHNPIIELKQIEGIPDLAIEVLSPSNRYEDLNEKYPAYREAGIKEIWLVDPDNEEVKIDKRRGKRYTSRTLSTGRIESSVLPGFWLNAEWLWSEPPPSDLLCLLEILGKRLV